MAMCSSLSRISGCVLITSSTSLGLFLLHNPIKIPAGSVTVLCSAPPRKQRRPLWQVTFQYHHILLLRALPSTTYYRSQREHLFRPSIGRHHVRSYVAGIRLEKINRIRRLGRIEIARISARINTSMRNDSLYIHQFYVPRYIIFQIFVQADSSLSRLLLRHPKQKIGYL